MDVRNKQFLNIIKAAMEGRTVGPCSPEDWQYFVDLAKQHKVLALLCDGMPGAVTPEVKMAVRQQVIVQAMKTSRFLELNSQLRQEGLLPLVVKGIACRQLYPNPDSRISSDEDLLLPQEQYAAGCRVLENFGMQTQDPEDASVRAYRMANEPLFVELHRQLLDPENGAYGDWNRYFADAHRRAVALQIEGQTVQTFHPTDHLFYLLCHAFKHFLHSGFGIRQVCDIAMYANAWGQQICWQQIMEQCEQIRAGLFAAAVFKIAEKHLSFDPVKACYPQKWQEVQVDEEPLLEDLLCSGIYGGATQSRKHSSNMTLQAVMDSNQGKKAKGTVLAALFPPFQYLAKRYPYLQKHAWLLPVAWVDRIIRYRKENDGSENASAQEALRIGNERLKLLRQYGVIS